MFFIISVENPAAGEHGECMSFPISSPPEGTWGRTTPALSHLPHIWICTRAQHQAMPSEEALKSGMEVQRFCWEKINLTGESSQYRILIHYINIMTEEMNKLYVGKGNILLIPNISTYFHALYNPLL